MKRNSIIIIVALTLVVALIGVLVYLNLTKDNRELEQLLQIDTRETMSETEQTEYDEVKQLLTEDPTDYEALRRLARIKQDLVDFNGAVDLYNKLLERKPNDILVLNNLGTIYYDSRRYPEAEATNLKILSITAKWLNAYRSLVDIYRYHLPEKQDNLLPILERGMAANIANYEADFLMMYVIYYDEMKHDNDKAIEYLERLLKVDPSNRGAEKRLAELKGEATEPGTSINNNGELKLNL